MYSCLFRYQWTYNLTTPKNKTDMVKSNSRSVSVQNHPAEPTSQVQSSPRNVPGTRDRGRTPSNSSVVETSQTLKETPQPSGETPRLSSWIPEELPADNPKNTKTHLVKSNSRSSGSARTHSAEPTSKARSSSRDVPGTRNRGRTPSKSSVEETSQTLKESPQPTGETLSPSSFVQQPIPIAEDL